jgi:predicted RNA-binding Zn ribbon-like protein
VTPRRPDAQGAAAQGPQGSGWRDLPFVGGDVTLDFVNTAGGRTKARDLDRLRSFADAVCFARATELVQSGEHDLLQARADAQPEEAERALDVLREQRESLHVFLLAAARGSACGPAARDRVETWLRTTYQQAHLSEDFWQAEPWHVDINDVGLDLLSRRLALATARLLGSDSRSHISECARCSWLFLDTSPSGRRRWCSMAICGNRSKAQRHYRRSRMS